MMDAGLLDDADQIYFLKHEEIGQLINDRNPGWKVKANRRRELLPELDKLVFEEVSFGIPEPLEQEIDIEIQEGQLKGIPVSSGIAEGRARIIHSLADAEKLMEGEIMVASFTDIGWTPYFSIISGLITEIGSPLSHGAVVAREFGIPAIVGAKGARRFLSDGDLVRLNGNRGIIEKIYDL
jgi:pyruvate,water dikinase